MVMQDIDKNNFTELMNGIGELYNKPITKPLLRIYFGAFKDLTIEQVEHGMNGHITSTDQAGSFFPKPADVIRVLFGTSKQQSQSVEDKAELSWSVIVNQISSIGSYGSPKIEDRQAMAALKGMGGWVRLCGSTVDELTWKKKEFISLYDTYERTPLDQLPSNLPGRIELEQHKNEEASNVVNLMQGLEQRKLRGK
jgi:hypothetical protein